MKNLIIALAFFSTLAASAQLSVKKLDGTPIVTGDLFVFNQLDEPGNYLGFKVYNLYTSQSMKVRAKCVSMSNATGNDLQLCLGDICLNTITTGSSYPSSPVTIPAGGQNSNYDHLLNNYPGTDPNQNVEYVIRISEVDNAGNEIGGSVQFTYRYDAGALATDLFTATNTKAAVLKTSVVSNNLEVKAYKNVQMEVFDVNGKTITRENMTAGDHTVDVSNLGTGVYIVNFTTEDNQKTVAKFIKK